MRLVKKILIGMGLICLTMGTYMMLCIDSFVGIGFIGLIVFTMGFTYIQNNVGSSD